jgi:ribosomal protein L37AE/L43A
LESENKRLRELLIDAQTALRDLGACDDPGCDEPNCLHVLPMIKQALENKKPVRPLPCPFCGSENLRIVEYGIECRNCGVWMGDGTQRRTIGKTLLDSWNHRTATPPRATNNQSPS